MNVFVVREIKDAFETVKDLEKIGVKNINGIIHCSGGAQTKVLHFLNDNLHVIKDNLFEPPYI